MSTNNKVFQVLPTKGNKAMLAAAKAVSDLTEGQLGIFDADTNISVDATSLATAKPKNFYIALGGPNGKVLFSTGQHIQVENVRNVNFEAPVRAVSYEFNIGNFLAENDMEYGLKLEFRNMEIYMRQGTNQFTKTFIAKTSSNTDVEPIQDLAWKLFTDINTNSGEMYTAKLLNPTTSDDISAKAAFDAWVLLNPGVAPDINITANDLAIMEYMGINPRYYFPRQTVIIPSLIGFTDEATITVVAEAVAEQGNAYEIKQKMYKAGGWNQKPGPYRTSSHLGFPYQELTGAYDGITEGAQYAQIHIVNDFFSTAGWGEYLSNCQTTIAIPEMDNITGTSVVFALNLLLGVTLI